MRSIVFLAIAFAMSLGCARAQPRPFIIDQGRPDRASPNPAPESETVPAPRSAGPQEKVAPFVLHSVRVVGSSLAPGRLAAVTRPFIGRTVGRKGLEEIANAVSREYERTGDIAFYTVFVPQQGFADGTLTLSVVEGFIEHVDLGGDAGPRLDLVKSYSGRLLGEHPLRRSTFQRYISLIRDVPGLTVDAKLLRGHSPGAVRLLLVLSQKKTHLSLSANDQGSNPLGRVQVQAKASLYGLLREGEETAVTVAVPVLVRRFQYVGLSDSEPLGDDGTTLQAAFGYLRTRPAPPSPSGTAKNVQLLVTHPVLRSFERNLSLSASIDGIDSSNATLGEIVADERIRAVRLSAVYNAATAQSAFGVAASMNFGLDIFAARTTDPRIADKGFRKFVLQATYNRMLAENWIVRLRAATQLGFDRLPVSELYSLGGDLGRAFPTAAAYGDSAVAGSVEIGFRPAQLPEALKGSELFGFVDDGGTWYRDRLGFGPQRFHLASAGAGVRVPVGKETKFELAAANALVADAPGLSPGKWRFIAAFTTAY